MKTTRKNPYTVLLEDIIAWGRKFRLRHTVSMFYWSIDGLRPDRAWRLDEVYQRALAAQTLGYEVIIEATDKGMTIKYRKTVELPFGWQ